MTHIIEPASSGRAKCRGCKQGISKGTLRFGERLPNPFADGEMTLWFHLRCAAYRRPEAIAEILDEVPDKAERAMFEALAKQASEHHRLPRLAGAERSPSSRARCRACRENIDKDDVRLALEFFEEGTFNPSGYIHLRCAESYFGTADLIERIQHFAQTLDDEALSEIDEILGSN